MKIVKITFLRYPVGRKFRRNRSISHGLGDMSTFAFFSIRQTHPGMVADPHSIDPKATGWTDLSSQAADVPHRPVDSRRKIGPPRSTPYEAHTVAPQEQLEGSRITRKGDSHSKIAPPPSAMVAGGKQFALRSTSTTTKKCSADLYRRIKRRVGRSLKQTHCKGNLVPSRKQATHKLPGTKGSLFDPKRVTRPL